MKAKPYKRPLRITNLQDTQHELSATTNLAKQAGIYLDAECATPIGDTPLALSGKQEVTLWVCLQPHLSADVLSGSVCRQLVGTIRVALHASDGGDLIEEKPIRFTATFGRSKLRVGPNAIRFGRLPAPVPGASPPAVHATLRVANLSEQIPLQWLSSCPAGLTLNPPSGKLPGFIELGGGGGKDAAALAARVSATDRAKVDATDRAVVGATTTPSLAPVGEDAASSGVRRAAIL